MRNPIEVPAALLPGRDFDRLVAAICALHEIDAEHRKGFRVGTASSDTASMLLHCASELNEVNEARTREHAEQELGDALAILAHVALALDLDLGRACQRWLEKIPADFPKVRGLVDRFGRPVGPPAEVPRA